MRLRDKRECGTCVGRLRVSWATALFTYAKTAGLS
jgi:hypothetical protein